MKKQSVKNSKHSIPGLERYAILEVLGEGLSSQVFRAQDTVGKKFVALKVFSSTDQSLVDHFKNEFKILSQLRHPHLVEVYDFGVSDDSRPYFTMEVLQGFPFSHEQLIVNGSVDYALVYRLILQIAGVLDFIHGHHITHGDIKPSNLLLLQDKKKTTTMKLMDFGLSRLRGETIHELAGTIDFMPPEVIRGETPDGRSDLYSLGVVLYEALAASLPFIDNTPRGVLLKHLQEIPRPLQEIVTDIPQELSTCVHKLLQKDPAMRFHSAYELMEYVAEVAGIPIESKSVRTTHSIFATAKRIARSREIAKLREMEIESHEHPVVALLQGEFGAGKTQLLRDLKSEFQLGEKKVFSIECQQNDQPFRPLLRILREVFRSQQAPANAEQWNILAAYFPNEFRFERVRKISTLENEAAKYRMYHATSSILTSNSVLPASMIIDDYQYADQLTKEFIQYFISYADANNCSGIFLVLVMDSSENIETIKALTDLPRVASMMIEPFSAAQTSEYIESILGKSVSHSFHQILYRQTGGNPLYLEEMLSFCQNKKIIERTRHGWQIHETENLARTFPTTLEEAVSRKIRELPDQEKAIIHALALSPLAMGLDVLAHVLKLPAEKILPLIAHLANKQFVAFERGKYRLKKIELAPVLQQDIPLEEKQPMHDRFLDWYKKPGHSEDVHPSIFAQHYLGSSNPTKALPYLLEAGDEAHRLFSYRAASKYYADALALETNGKKLHDKYALLLKLTSVYNVLGLRQLEEDGIEESMVIAAQLNDNAKLAAVYQNQTEYYLALGEYQRARKSAEKALSLFETAKDKQGIAKSLAKIGWTFYRSRQGDELAKYYERALQIYNSIDAPIDEGNVLIDLALAYFYVLNSSEKAVEYLERARQKFEKVSHQPGLARALGNTGVQKFDLGDYDEALRYYDEAQKIYAEIGDRRGIAIAYNAYGQALLAVGKFSEALQYLERSLKVAKEINDLHAQERTLENLGELFVTLGNYPMSLQYYENARAIAVKIGNKIGIISNDIEIAGVKTEQKEFEHALKLLARAREQMENIHDVNVSSWLEYRTGMCRYAMGGGKNFVDASEHFRKLGDLADQHGFDSLRIIARSYLAICQVQVGNVDQALEFSESALALLKDKKTIIGGVHDILFHHAKILRVQKKSQEAAAFISQAHDALLARAQSITDSELYRTYLENVRLHAEIRREYANIHRTESPQSLAALHERNLKAFYDVSRAVNSVLDFPELLETIMDSALQTMNGERGMIFLIENEQLVLKIARNVESQTILDATEISVSIMGDVIHGGKPIIVSNAQQDADFKNRQSVVNFKIHSLICVPIKSKEKLIGTVYVDSRADAMQSVMFQETDLEFLEVFANLAAIAIENAKLHAQLKEENIYLRKEIEDKYAFDSIVGQSAPMLQLYRQIREATASEGNVLIIGESGTGKELVARAIHYNGSRKLEHFVPVDCGALPDTLLESELFGYKKGAFTGAYTDKRGLFEEAHLGTLFLDEISNTSLAFQAKLLRVLQEGEYRRVGDTESRYVNVRVVCATNRDLQQEIREGRFRQDLFFRLNVIPIVVPTLRDRTSDIPLLVEHFIEQHNAKFHSNIKGASKELLDYFMSVPWFGNIRELENIINRMLVSSPGDVLSLKHLPSDFAEGQPKFSAASDMSVPLRPPKRLSTMADTEREHIKYVLQFTNGNKTEAAKILEIKRTTLVERMKKLGMM